MDALYLLEIVLVVTVLSFLALRLRILDSRGTALASFVGFLVYWGFGRVGFVTLASFVIVAGLATKLGYGAKKMKGGAEPRKGLRGWRNVAGNGLIAAAIAAVCLALPQYEELLLASFIGAVAAVFGDTMATEIGLLSRAKPRSIIGFNTVNPGTPGGVTLLGYIGAVSSGVILSGVATLLTATNPLDRSLALYSALGGALIGTTVDSVVGQLFQAVYRCETCGAMTEHRQHCTGEARLVRGYRFVGNQSVNIVASIAGALWGLTIAASLSS